MAEEQDYKSLMPSDDAFRQKLAERHRRGRFGKLFYYISIAIALLALVTLFVNVLDETFGTIAVEFQIPPEDLTPEGTPIAELSSEAMALLIEEHASGGLLVLIRDELSQVEKGDYTKVPVKTILQGKTIPEGTGDMMILDTTVDQQVAILTENFSRARIEEIVWDRVVGRSVVASWPLFQTVFDYDSILAEQQSEHPEATLQFHSWLNGEFITSTMSSIPADAGIRTAALGTLGLMGIVIAFALPVGVGAAIYLEEYATDNWINRIIETNIRNLAGVPSIIYGMLGLAVLVRVFAPFTAGQIFGYNLPEQAPAFIDQQIVDSFNAAVTAEIADLEAQIAALDAEQDAAAIAGLQAQIDELAVIEYESIDDIDKLSQQDYEAIVGVYMNFRELKPSNLFTFGVPSAEAVEAELAAAIDLNQYSQYEILALDETIKVYGSFTINGRTIMSAGLTLGLLILPIIIINAQEALRAVPWTIREASYGLGATKWQTIWRQTLPAALPGILTGVILSVSRAVGETAPLIVVGASTFILTDPEGPFSQFTALPIQIFQWTARPQDQYRDIAAAAIVALLVIILTLNATAIILRNRYSVRY